MALILACGRVARRAAGFATVAMLACILPAASSGCSKSPSCALGRAELEAKFAEAVAKWNATTEEKQARYLKMWQQAVAPTGVAAEPLDGVRILAMREDDRGSNDQSCSCSVAIDFASHPAVLWVLEDYRQSLGAEGRPELDKIDGRPAVCVPFEVFMLENGEVRTRLAK